ncbi:hypothetical protein PHYBLDRAFT_142333 [Phycomyces blakesleeanus NRRL 1555(-)]|uniref:Uncharacterized protein n=1 Tax=Phycomyces blakesleeanus (strain ATCC 8743b / DSM 1359 / FGSC 10004 / NBRC 33097 / NRRL 1555) TaxID=763407 RepID=A0A167NXN6_PHYB8|nr:hypothetical protein PHYBLDRAFT_142333 [Phycomyces blakesleeanus NRRL 1555(-)]OAD76831.1 hypothetical protein PHYBLDRAFT_142333 [Phycomyces blakesleeanus NRRL 1555(-)]|eukprot:XP_018294871.1 hypothetical protein PHYBLDRAFT_142333 [Phycomyces blakesleeanus NRRL 1555(-)]
MSDHMYVRMCQYLGPGIGIGIGIGLYKMYFNCSSATLSPARSLFPLENLFLPSLAARVHHPERP